VAFGDATVAGAPVPTPASDVVGGGVIGAVEAVTETGGTVVGLLVSSVADEAVSAGSEESSSPHAASDATRTTASSPGGQCRPRREVRDRGCRRVVMRAACAGELTPC
jgi:hypothetical protein